jgi:hypothetical protein
MGDFRDLYKQGRLTWLIYFSWNSDHWSKQVSASAIFRCGTLTPGGELALRPFNKYLLILSPLPVMQRGCSKIKNNDCYPGQDAVITE